jgi:SAM-dependent methyltransferase
MLAACSRTSDAAAGPTGAALPRLWQSSAMIDDLHTRVRRLPPRRRQQLRRAVRRPIWGNLRRLEPFSASFGFDRGTPVDRFYMRHFIRAHTDALRGVAGEVSEPTYLAEFGGDRLTRIEVIDLDPANPRATLIADLSQSASLPAETFDCLVVTQTLQYIPEPERALAVCVEALRPAGSLLVAVPALAPHDTHEAPEADHWRFWPAGLLSLLRRVAPDASHTVVGYGNLVATIAFLHGLSAEELKPAELRHSDPRFPVVVCARVDMPGPRP